MDMKNSPFQIHLAFFDLILPSEMSPVKLIQSLCQNFRIFLIYHMAGVVQLLQLRLLDVLGQEMS